MNHPHICALYDVGEQDGRDYLVMELLEGETIARRLARGPLPPDQILRHAIDIAEALDHAHRHGDRSPRPEAGQRHADQGWREAARLRPREVARDEAAWLPRVAPDHDSRAVR